MPRTARRRPGFALATRWLGVGLGSIVAVVTVSLAVTGRIGLFINPDAAWWAVSMAILLLVGAVGSFAIRLGDEHEHDHGHEGTHEHTHSHEGTAEHEHLRGEAHADAGGDAASAREPDRRPLAIAAAVSGGVIATVIAVAGLLLPPQSLSTELALSRSTGAAPLFGGSSSITLASASDTSGFGIGEWSAALAASTDPSAYIGLPATLVGFVGPGGGSGFELTRLVITHCVIDAQTASIPVADSDAAQLDAAQLDVGQWVEVSGEWRSEDGQLVFEPTSVAMIDEPEDPYEY